MRKELGVLLMEDENGEVAVQLFAKVSEVEKAFIDLKGSPANKPSRATLVSLKFPEDGVVQVVTTTKVLPIIESVENRPDGYVLGEGPVRFPKE